MFIYKEGATVNGGVAKDKEGAAVNGGALSTIKKWIWGGFGS